MSDATAPASRATDPRAARVVFARSPDSGVRSLRDRADYNAAERRFSRALQTRLRELLDGRRNVVELLRIYPGQRQRLGVIRTGEDVDRERLRLDVVERITWGAVDFFCADPLGGPISQQVHDNGEVTEFRMFATRFPHIVLARTDRYPPRSRRPTDITWCMQRVQNQRTSTQVNRFLDAANLALDLFRSIGGGA